MKKYLFEVGQQLADVFYNQENIKPLNQNRMTTKEKAKELFDKMQVNAIYKSKSKDCALISVDEIIKVLYSLKFGNALSDEIEYYEQVKQEIINL